MQRQPWLTICLLCLGAAACGSTSSDGSPAVGDGSGLADGGKDATSAVIDGSAVADAAATDTSTGSGSDSGDVSSDSGADAGPITAQGAILKMQRGINIGNTFDAPPGETAWGNPAVEDYYFDDYVTAGFTAIRIPVTWDQHTGANAPYTIDEAFIARVEQVVDWGLSRGLFILVNAHHESWIKQDTSAGNVARFAAIWSQISTRFKGKSEKLVFEILNEPETMTVQNLDALNEQILGVIRQTNPTRLVVYAGSNYSSDWDLTQVKVPGAVDKYLIANFHCYSPWSFVSGDATVIWGSQTDKDAIKGIFDGVAQFVSSKGIPAMVNEFGAGPNHDTNSRTAFYQTYVDNTLSHGMAFFAWDDGGDFRTYDRQLPAAHAPGGQWVGNVKDIMTH